MKRTFKTLIVALLVVIFAMAFVSCGKNKKDKRSDNFSLEIGTMPQTVFVLGEEPDLSAGTLLIKDGGKEEKISMGDKDVKLSGFDKNVLGAQTMTLTYSGKSVSFDVKVVNRMQVEDHKADYLVGDTLDLSTGRLKITRNDGSNFTVILKSDKVKVESFDSTTAGQKNVKVTYTSGSETYVSSFNVNVHNVENVSFTRPTKIAYNSHDSGVSVAGGIITLSALNGAVKKEIAVTEDMISGFDLSLAKDPDAPLTQLVTVTYDANNVFNYEIRITYTSVSQFKDHAYLSDNYDFSNVDMDTEFDIDPVDGEEALKMMELYIDMSPNEQSLLTREEVIKMARVAMVYAYNLWGEDLLMFEGAFGFNAYGEFEFQCKSAEAIANAVELLKDKDRALYTKYDILDAMLNTFGEEILFSYYENDVKYDVYFGEYGIFDPAVFDELVGLFEYMLELDELMDEVGPDWREDINKYSAQIEAVYESMINSDYYMADYAQFFIYVSLWRGVDDAFDFLYHYYFEVQENVEAVIMIANLRLPTQLEEIFVYVYEAMNQIDYIANYYTADTTQFFYNYFMAIKLANELIGSDAEEDKMAQVLFYALPLNSMLGMNTDDGLYYFMDMIDYLCTTQGGYYSLCGALLGNAKFEALLDQYLYIITTLFENYEEDADGNSFNTYENTEEYVADIKAMLELYMELNPSEQFFFIGTLNAYYAMNIPPYAFDTTGEYGEFIALFFDMINDTYLAMFETETGKEVYLKLMMATEAYAQRYNSENWKEDFTTWMQFIEDALAGTEMSAQDKALFTVELGYIYDKYTAFLPSEDDGETEKEPIDLGEWEDEFKALEKAVINLELAYALINEGANYYGLFFSAYERAVAIANSILEGDASDAIKEYLIYSDIYSIYALDRLLDPNFVVEEEQFWSYDYMLTFYRAIYVNALVAFSDGVYEYYFDYDMPEFLASTYDLYWSFLWEEEYDKDAVLAMLNNFTKLNSSAKIIFIYYIEGEYDLYYRAVDDFIAKNYESEAVVNAFNNLMSVEMVAIEFCYFYEYYYAYFESGQISEEELMQVVEQLLPDLNEAYAALEASYIALGENEALFLEDFGDIYEYYKSLVEDANALLEAGEETPAA